MRVIGITGGVGSGKSEVLGYLKNKCNCRVILADQVAHLLEEPGQICYKLIVELLGREILDEKGYIDKHKLANRIFANEEYLEKVNCIVHPEVRAYIEEAILEERKKDTLDYLFIEAALLIEKGYKDIVDEMWYIHTREEARRDRLKASRGYTDEKIDSIIKQQLSEKEFFEQCDFVLENSGSLACMYKQIDEKLRENLCQK